MRQGRDYMGCFIIFLDSQIENFIKSLDFFCACFPRYAAEKLIIKINLRLGQKLIIKGKGKDFFNRRTNKDSNGLFDIFKMLPQRRNCGYQSCKNMAVFLKFREIVLDDSMGNCRADIFSAKDIFSVFIKAGKIGRKFVKRTEQSIFMFCRGYGP